jgi:uncharacterized protein YqeY
LSEADCIFCKIARGEMDAEVVHDEDDVLAFEDINSKAPVHVLVIPRQHVANLEEIGDLPDSVVKRLFEVSSAVAGKLGVTEGGYAVRVNNGSDAGQEVFHLHLHVMGGKNAVSARDRIQADTKTAMKERDKTRVGALRMLGAALKNAEIEAGRPLTEQEEQTILRRQLKQRDESAEAFRKAGREERAASESAEAEIVRSYLPQPLSPAELEEIADRAIDETGATGMRDMGNAMGRAMELSEGRAEGRQLSAIVRNRLQ